MPIPDTAAHARRRALVIDDEPAVRSVLSRWLRRAGWEVLTADGGNAAVQLLGQPDERTVGYDVVICDLRMPELSGPELYEWLATHRPELCAHVVFSSGDVCDPAVAGFLEASGCPVLEKPFSLPDLSRVVSLAAELPPRAA